MNKMRFGLIGTGFMGKAHAIALRSVGTVFPEVPAPQLDCLVDRDIAHAKECAEAWGFHRSGDDWQALCNDHDIDVVSICTPNHLHKEMSVAAAAAGKHIWCEKPLGLSAPEAKEIWQAAEQAGVRTSMGFNYMCNPLLALAREIVESGEIGEVFNFRSSYQEDYLSDPLAPFSWRCLRSQGGSGALNDLGTHLINMAEYLLGPLSSVYGSLVTVHTHRTDPATGESREVENEDIAQVLVRFARGSVGTMEISRVGTGKKCGLDFEIHGSKGALMFDQERMNEIRLFRTDDSADKSGYRTILAGPEHQDYAKFCPAPGHGLGINDLKIIEARNFLQSIVTDTPIHCDFKNGWRVQEIVDAVELSHRDQQWIDVSEGLN